MTDFDYDLNELLPYLRPDFLDLDRYHRTLKNELHSHLSWPFTKDFTEAQEPQYVPLDKRKPLVIVPIGKQIVETVVSYTFGKGNFPKVSARTTKDVFGLGENPDVVNSKLGKFVTQLVHRSFLASVIMRAARLALSMKKCIAYFKYVDGKPDWEIINWKWVQNERYKSDGKTLESFDCITYECGFDEDGEPCIWWHKCSYDEQGERTYAPVKHVDGEQPKFTRVEKDVTHGLGMCPAIVLVASQDNESIFEGQVDNIFQYSIFVSCVVVGIRKNMNPQRIWMGDTPPNMQNLIRSSDTVWAMPEGKFVSDAPNPQAYQYAIEMEHRLREIILRGARTVEIPNQNYQSGEALKMKIAPELNLVQETRTELGDRALVDMLTMATKVTCLLNERQSEREDESGDRVIERSLIKLGPDVSIPLSEYVDDIDITLGWGEIFIPTAESKNLDIQTAVMAIKGDDATGSDPMFSELTIRNAMSSHFNVVDMNSEQAQIERERINRLNNKAINALIDLCVKSNRPDMILKLLEALNEQSTVNLAYEYNSSLDINKITDTINAAIEQVEDAAEGEEPEDESEDDDKEMELEDAQDK